MTSGRDRVRMSDEEVADFLAAATKLQVATIGPDGSPHLTTLFHVVRDGRLAFWTYGSSQKVLNLERDPRITCLVEDGEGYLELRGVSVRGTATVLRDEADVRAVGTAVALRMTGATELDEGSAAMVEQQVPKRVAIVVEPDKVASWDHRKMLG